MQLEAHEREEQQTLGEYQDAAKAAPDAGVRYLMSLVLEDEERHHRLSQAMAHEVHDSLLWLQREAPLPEVNPAPEERQKLLRQTERFLRIEEDGERQLADLHHQVKELHAGLLELIVDVMRADTEKHVHILKYIKKRLEARQPRSLSACRDRFRAQRRCARRATQAAWPGRPFAEAEA